MITNLDFSQIELYICNRIILFFLIYCLFGWNLLMAKNEMYKTILFIWSFFTVVLVCSCSDKTLDISCTPILLNSTDTTSISFDDCFEILSCIPLEETNDCYITNIRRVEYFEGNYYISSSDANVGLVVFDAKGNFVRRIGKKGNGHGEYTNIYDFSIDKKNRRILILCNRNSLVKVYSLDGVFQKEKILHNTSLNDLACIDGVILCPTNHQGFATVENDSLFYVFDEDLNLVKRHTYVSNNSVGMSSFIPSNIRAHKKMFIYSDFHEHRIFILNEHGDVNNCYEYRKDNLIPIEALESPRTFMDKQFEYDFILNNAILDDKCITIYKEGRRMKLSINMINGECVINRPLNSVLPDFVGYENDYILSVISLENLKEFNPSLYHKYTGDACYFIIKYKLKKI